MWNELVLLPSVLLTLAPLSHLDLELSQYGEDLVTGDDLTGGGSSIQELQCRETEVMASETSVVEL